MGLVLETYPGEDGLARKAEIKQQRQSMIDQFTNV